MEMDVCWKEYFRDDARYADVINGIGCGGQRLVEAKDLQEADSQTVFGKWYKVLGKGGRVRIRDVIRKVAFGVNFAIIGFENQEMVDYSMPLRCMVYDAGEYEKQAGKIRKKLRKQKGLRAEEYLYGFSKNSRLYPVVTFILYGGKAPWDGPESLHDMLDWTDVPEKLKRFVSDYPIHVVKIREFENTDVFKTDVKQVFDFIRCSGDRRTLAELVQNDKNFQSMEEDAYEVVTQYVKADELIQVKDEYRGKDGKINMCQALKELIEEGREEGRAEGRTSGLADGRKEATRNIVIRMVKKGKADEEIMELTECSAELIWEIRSSMTE
ncbi:MAG: transposase [Lachnospiraceae bacterium]|nr:transposase [Lachnospiraceae bacterium]